MDNPIAYLSTPAVIVNQALDSIGVPGKLIADITDGTDVAEVARRNYSQALRQLLRTAQWNFARKRARLTLLGDATGQSAPPVITTVEPNWTYAYAWPIDAVAARWLPYGIPNGQPLQPNGVPLTTGVSAIGQYPNLPGRFLVSSSDKYPIETGYVPWDQQPDLQRTEGLGPINRKIILTDCCNADLVYTRFVPVIEEWDNLFRQAMVSLMALVLIPVAITDPKLRVAERDRQIGIAKNMIADARVANGNDAGFPQSVDHQPVWITARNGGGANWAGAGPGGSLYTGYDFVPCDGSLSWCGSVF